MARYLNAAGMATDPVERMKFVMTASIAFLYPCHTWDKPLNPILGETFQAPVRSLQRATGHMDIRKNFPYLEVCSPFHNSVYQGGHCCTYICHV